MLRVQCEEGAIPFTEFLHESRFSRRHCCCFVLCSCCLCRALDLYLQTAVSVTSARCICSQDMGGQPGSRRCKLHCLLTVSVRRYKKMQYKRKIYITLSLHALRADGISDAQRNNTASSVMFTENLSDVAMLSVLCICDCAGNERSRVYLLMAAEQDLLECYFHWQHAPAMIVLCEWQNTQVLPPVVIHVAYCKSHTI